jgi:hypothetical protein
MFVELRGGSLSPWILYVILWLGGKLNFIAFISLLTTIVLSILLQIFSPSKDILIPCTIFIWLISLWSLFSFPPLIVHYPLSNIIHSNFSILGTFFFFFSRIEVQCTKSIIHCDTFDSCQNDGLCYLLLSLIFIDYSMDFQCLKFFYYILHVEFVAKNDILL